MKGHAKGPRPHMDEALSDFLVLMKLLHLKETKETLFQATSAPGR